MKFGIESPRNPMHGTDVLDAGNLTRTVYIISLEEAQKNIARAALMLQCSIHSLLTTKNVTSLSITQLKTAKSALERHLKFLSKVLNEEITNGQKEIDNSINFTKQPIKN